MQRCSTEFTTTRVVVVVQNNKKIYAGFYQLPSICDNDLTVPGNSHSKFRTAMFVGMHEGFIQRLITTLNDPIVKPHKYCKRLY